MGAITPITNTVFGDETAWSYQEVHIQSPRSRGFRRYRVILVNRDGNLAEYKEDMGSVNKWRGVKCFNIPSLWCHSVDELRDIADYLRAETEIDIKDLLELDNMKLTS